MSCTSSLSLGRRTESFPFHFEEWAQRSKGLVLFIDEADAFLRRGRGHQSSMCPGSTLRV